MNEKYISTNFRDSLETTKGIMQRSYPNTLCEEQCIFLTIRLYLTALILAASRITHCIGTQVVLHVQVGLRGAGVIGHRLSAGGG